MSRTLGSKNKPKLRTLMGEYANMSKSVKNYKGESVDLTDKPDEVKSGEITETFKIKVATKDDEGKETVHYENKEEPFTFTRYGSLSDILNLEIKGLKVEGLEGLSSDQSEFLKGALEGDNIGKAVQAIVDVYNANVRSNAKQNQYTRVTNATTPLTDEDKASAMDKMVKNFALIYGVSYEVAKEKLAGLAK